MERLSRIEGRVLASLVEKQLLTPQTYPLTLHALTAACNQSTSREPVMALGDGEVEWALEALKSKRLVRFVLPSHGRSVVRYRQVLDEVLAIDAPQLAVLAMLELRGPQTVAELRARTERMAPIESVPHELALLAGATPPLVARLERRPGQKEERWQTLLCDPPPGGTEWPRPAAAEAHTAAHTEPDTEAPAAALDALHATVESLRAEVAVVRAELAALRESLGG